MSRHFQPSPFWIAARRMFSWRFLVAIVIVLGCFEAVARVAPWIVGRQVHQRYLYYERLCERECTNQGQPLVWSTNARGARGTLYHGEPVRIAVLGSSTTSNTLLDQNQLWTERLRVMLGADVHIDNYARDGAADLESVAILENFADTGRRYDGVLIMTHVALNKSAGGNPERSAFRFWKDWAPRGGILEFPAMLQRRVRHQLKQEPRLWNPYRRWTAGRRAPEPEDRALDPANRELRRQGKVRLVDYEVPLTADEEAGLRERTRQMIVAAQGVADRVWLIRQPVAYDENEVAGVADRWMSLVPVPGRDDVFLSNRSYAASIRGWQGVMVDEARRMGAGTIDLDAAMRPLLAERADLFEDKWHFAPAGAEVAARILANELAGELTLAGRTGQGGARGDSDGGSASDASP